MNPVGRRRRSRLLLVAVIVGLIPSTIVGVFRPKPALASSSYETNVKNDSPSVYYRLDESSGTTASDDSGNSVTGTYAGSGITYGVTGAIQGDSDKAITSNESNATVTASDTSLPSGSSARTLELWLKTTADPASSSRDRRGCRSLLVEFDPLYPWVRVGHCRFLLTVQPQ
jgi:hypothetical protein